MLLRISQLRLPLDYTKVNISKVLSKKINCKEKFISRIKIQRRAIDARSAKEEPTYTMTVECKLSLPELPKDAHKRDIKIIEKEKVEPLPKVELKENESRPVIVGAGPAGLYAALTLAEAGLKPLLLEQGSAASEREAEVDAFWKKGELKTESNVLFGEGGAGLFSDGKLTARTKDNQRMDHFFKTLVDCGAPHAIMVDALPHVGSDELLKIVPLFRQKILDLGGEIRFNTKVDEVIIKDEVLTAVMVNGEEIATNHCILAVGHSARDVYQMLLDKGVALEAKPLAIGVRVEFSQRQLNKAQWGRWANNKNLGPASYRLTRRKEGDARDCYSFCMCPGGTVIPCASEPGMMTTNGMSLEARDRKFSNAAFLVPVTPEDFKTETKSDSPLAGIDFQREIEKKAFIQGGSSYGMPAMRLADLIAGIPSKSLPDSLSFENSVPGDIREILPEFICTTLKSAIPKMLKQLKGLRLHDVVIYAAETRSSSPVRIVRDDSCQCTGISGLFPAGEGAGYAGGIVSSAIDGIRAAENVIQSYLKS